MAADRDIEEHFARATLAFLQGKLRPRGADCPHPGFLSAHREGKLADEGAATIEAHLGMCPDCREQLAALANLEPVGSATIESEPELAADEPEPEPMSKSAQAAIPRTRSGGPLPIAAIVVLGIAVAYPFSSLLGNPRAMLERWLGSPEKPVIPPEPAPSTHITPEAILAAVPPAEPSPAPAVPPQVAKPPAVVPRAREPVKKTPAPPSVRAAEVVITPRANGDVRWRFAGSRIERSDDGGRSWRPQTSHATSPLLAASAPSGEACWAGGKNGTVVRTNDGRIWEAVKPPTSDDIVEVIASSAASATVKSARGDRYSTIDGGATWSRL